MSLQWIKISVLPEQTEKINDFSIRSIEVNNRKICLVKLPDGFFAVDDKCPHAGGRLSFGKCDDDGNIICPVHRYKFNAKTGKGLQGDFVNTYPVEIRDDGIYIGMKKRFLFF